MCANSRVSVPAFIGVFCPVAKPDGVVGKIRAKVQGVQNRKAADRQKPNRIKIALGRTLQ